MRVSNALHAEWQLYVMPAIKYGKPETLKFTLRLFLENMKTTYMIIMIRYMNGHKNIKLFKVVSYFFFRFSAINGVLAKCVQLTSRFQRNYYY